MIVKEVSEEMVVALRVVASKIAEDEASDEKVHLPVIVSFSPNSLIC